MWLFINSKCTTNDVQKSVRKEIPRAAAVHVRSVNVQKAKMQPTNVHPRQTLTDKKEV